MEQLRKALEEARQAIADAPQDAWGFVEDRDQHGQPIVWPIKDELLSHIDAALAEQPAPGTVDGWKMVPVEPTWEMGAAMRRSENPVTQWRNALAAAA